MQHHPILHIQFIYIPKALKTNDLDETDDTQAPTEVATPMNEDCSLRNAVLRSFFVCTCECVCVVGGFVI